MRTHAPEVQVLPVAFGAELGHALPHAAQFVEVPSAISHPFEATPSQLLQPLSQASSVQV